MNVLILGTNDGQDSFYNATFSSLVNSNPFGYDTIVVDPDNINALAGTNQTNILWTRWNEFLNKWMSPSHRIIVLMRPTATSGSRNNYDWMPLEGFNPRNFQPCGESDFVGTLTSQDAYVKQYFRDEDIQHTVRVHYKNVPDETRIQVNCKIDDELLTSFTWRDGIKEVIFIPTTRLSNLRGLVNSFDAASNIWKLPKAKELEASINEYGSQIIDIEEKQTQLQDEVNQLNNTVQNIINSDIYLSQAVRAYELVQNTENPDPENYYAAVEAIENAFKSERDMRDELGFSKTQIGKLTQRTNEFRHIAKSGQDPTSLTVDEIKDFTELIENIISKYIDYLYKNDQI